MALEFAPGKTRIGWVGTGVMGSSMCGHLMAAGYAATVYNRTAAKSEKWVAQYGGRSAPTPKAAAEGQDFVMCCVGNDNDLRAVTLGADGAFAGVKKGATFVDHTTASADEIKLGVRFLAKQTALLEAKHAAAPRAAAVADFCHALLNTNVSSRLMFSIFSASVTCDPLASEI